MFPSFNVNVGVGSHVCFCMACAMVLVWSLNWFALCKCFPWCDVSWSFLLQVVYLCVHSIRDQPFVFPSVLPLVLQRGRRVGCVCSFFLFGSFRLVSLLVPVCSTDWFLQLSPNGESASGTSVSEFYPSFDGDKFLIFILPSRRKAILMLVTSLHSDRTSSKSVDHPPVSLLAGDDVSSVLFPFGFLDPSPAGLCTSWSVGCVHWAVGCVHSSFQHAKVSGHSSVVSVCLTGV